MAEIKKTLKTTITYTAVATLGTGPGGEVTRWRIGNFSHGPNTPDEADADLRAQLDALNEELARQR